MSYLQLSERQAEELLAHMVVREPFRLQSLARRIASFGGDLEAFDGSFESLETLWAWFIEYVAAGLPGLDRDARPSAWRVTWAEGLHMSPDQIAMTVVGEEMDHYVRQVFVRWAPPGDWVLQRTEDPRLFPSPQEYRPGVVLEGVWRMGLWGSILVESVIYRSLARENDRDAMTRWMRRVGAMPEGVVQERGPSVLAPYLEVDLGPEPPESAVSPMWGWAELGPEPSSGLPPLPPPAGEAVTLWRGSWDAVDEIDQAGVLDPVALAEVLAEVGGTVGGAVVTAEVLVDGSAEVDDCVEVEVGDNLVRVDVFLLDGTVRQVSAEPFAATKSQWRAVRGALRRYAKSQKARMVTDSEMQ